MPHDPNILSMIETNDVKSIKALSMNHPDQLINAINDAGETYFHVATRKLLVKDGVYDLDLLEELLNAGIDPAVPNQKGNTALDQVEDLNCLDSEVGHPPLLRCIDNTPPLKRLFDVLLANPKVNKNCATKNGMSAICAAGYNGQPDMLKKLINVGANIYLGYKNYNPLAMAITKRSNELNAETRKKLGDCISLLLENYVGIGASFNLNPFDDKDIKAIEGIDFTDRILLGAKIHDRFKEVNRTLKKALFTVDNFIAKLPAEQNLALVEVNKIKDICNTIATHCKEYDKDMYQRIFNIIQDLEKLSQRLNAANEPAKKEEKKEGFSGLFKIFKSSKSAASNSQSNSSSPSIGAPSTLQPPKKG